MSAPTYGTGRHEGSLRAQRGGSSVNWSSRATEGATVGEGAAVSAEARGAGCDSCAFTEGATFVDPALGSCSALHEPGCPALQASSVAPARPTQRASAPKEPSAKATHQCGSTNPEPAIAGYRATCGVGCAQQGGVIGHYIFEVLRPTGLQPRSVDGPRGNEGQEIKLAALDKAAAGARLNGLRIEAMRGGAPCRGAAAEARFLISHPSSFAARRCPTGAMPSRLQ
jgi:hypothetical protein